MPADRGSESVVASPRRPAESRLDDLPMVALVRRHPAVGRLRGSGSLSIGSPTDGFVVDCRTLPPRGAHHAILDEHSRRGTACATSDLVDAILRAAETVDRAAPGARLGVGNLGRTGGGDIPWSVSHRSGRDADLSFYLLDDAGKPFLPSTLVHLDRQGRGAIDGVAVHLDLPRTWRLVKALLDDGTISVQWLFVSRSLRRALLAWAAKAREPAPLLRRAEEVLAQPARSRPHDDHLHLRIACPADDVLEGCRDTGSQRSWFRDPSPRVAARERELLALARSTDPSTRADATTVLGRLGTPAGRRTVLARLDDPDGAVRLAAARALVDGGVEGIEDDLLARLERGSDGDEAGAILAALDRHVRAWRRPGLLRSLLAIERPYRVDLGLFEVRRPIRDWAVDAAGRLPASAAVRLVIEAMAAGVLPAARAAEALRDWTGARPDADAAGDERAVVAAWQGWWRTHRELPPREWWSEALRARGLAAEPDPDARTLAERPFDPGPGTNRWFAQAVSSVLGVRMSRFDIGSMPERLRRAAAAGEVEAAADRDGDAAPGRCPPSDGPADGVPPGEGRPCEALPAAPDGAAESAPGPEGPD